MIRKKIQLLIAVGSCISLLGCTQSLQPYSSKLHEFYLSGSNTTNNNIHTSGTLAQVYYIRDHIYDLSFRYILYQNYSGSQDTLDIKYSTDQLRTTLILPWGAYRLYKIHSEELQQASGCYLVDISSGFLTSYPMWPSGTTVTTVGFLEQFNKPDEGEQRINYSGCIFYEPGSRRFPLFISKPHKPQEILVIEQQEGGGSKEDASRISTLQR